MTAVFEKTKSVFGNSFLVDANVKSAIIGYTLAFIGIIIGANLSAGSEDIYVELEQI